MQAQHLFAFLGMPSGWEWLVILVIALLLFGRRLPEVMRGIGSGVREFRKGIETGDDEGRKKDQDRVERLESQPATEGGSSASPAGEQR